MRSGVFNTNQILTAIREGAWTGQKPQYVEYLVVAGGGGGGGKAAYGGGGGGAGGLLAGMLNVVPATSYTVTIGTGGAGSESSNGSSGLDSVFGPITATGGGYGSYGYSLGGAGGSAGGTGTDFQEPGQRVPAFANGVAGQGNSGGWSYSRPAGGGGGAGTPGSSGGSGTGAWGAFGGSGVASDITGIRTPYAAGGSGGGSYTGVEGGAGGGGASGNGSATSGGATAATSAAANTGCGGGGNGQNYAGVSGSGGSGIVVISYPDIYEAAASTTGSPTISTSGAGSVYLDGTGDYLDFISSAISVAGEFTAEAWVYNTGVNSPQILSYGEATTYNHQIIRINGGYQYTTGLGASITGSIAVPSNEWVHLAISRDSGGTIRLFTNGVLAGSATPSVVTAQIGMIGGVLVSGTPSDLLTGYVTNVRVVNGTCLYTSSFSVPTLPLTLVTNTALLVNTSSGSPFVDWSSSQKIIKAYGNATWNQLSPFPTGIGLKNRVYKFTSSGSITF